MEDKETALYDACGFQNASDMDTLYTKLRKRQENKMGYEKRKAAAAAAVAAAAVAAEAATAAAAAAAAAAEAAVAAVASTAAATLPISSDALAVIELQNPKRGLEEGGQSQ